MNHLYERDCLRKTEADEYGIRTLLITLNGRSRQIDAQDRSLVPETPTCEKADAGKEGQVAAPHERSDDTCHRGEAER